MLRIVIPVWTICVFSIFTVSAQETIKILSYNIHHGNPPSEKAGYIDLPAIANVINESKADIIGLQEVDVNVERSGDVDQIKELAKLTDTEYYFAKGIDLQGGEYGVAVLSKLPITHAENFSLPMTKNGEQRVLASITVETKKCRVLVIDRMRYVYGSDVVVVT